jgi:hypothetical protein
VDQGDGNPKHRLPVDPHLLRMPEGLTTSGDPQDGGNPYPDGTPYHALWRQATRIAEEAVARLKAEWMHEMRALPSPQSLDDLTRQSAQLSAQHRDVRLREFEIWGARAAQVVLTDVDLRHFDDWIVGYAESSLEFHASGMHQYGLSPHVISNEVAAFRQGLAGVVFHLKAEARRMLGIREQEREEAARTDAPSPAKPKTPDLVLAKRADWLSAALEARRWTATDLERQGGPSVKTTRRILAGDAVRETALEKLAQALSRLKGRVHRRDIPG